MTSHTKKCGKNSPQNIHSEHQFTIENRVSSHLSEIMSSIYLSEPLLVILSAFLTRFNGLMASRCKQVDSPNVICSADHIQSSYELKSTVFSEGRLRVKSERIIFQTERRVPKLGVMLVGWGGNNGSTVTAGILANKLGISWETKEGIQAPNYFGSVTQASTVRIATDDGGRNVFTAFNNVVPMVNPNDIVVGGWDISSMNLADSMKRARVLDVDLQRKLVPHMQGLVPLPSIYYPDFIAMNQGDRADNILPGTKADHLAEIQKNIREFKLANSLDKVGS